MPLFPQPVQRCPDTNLFPKGRTDWRRIGRSSHGRSLTPLNGAAFRDDASERGPQGYLAHSPMAGLFAASNAGPVLTGCATAPNMPSKGRAPVFYDWPASGA